jgi:thioredoxin 1
MTRRKLFALAGVLALTVAGRAQAATVVPYDAAAFAADQAAGKPILVHVNASWCPNCAKQRPIIDQLAATPAFANLIIMRVDFDSEKPVVRSLGVQMLSTLIVFHGRDERGRATAITDPAAIKALLEKAES